MQDYSENFFQNSTQRIVFAYTEISWRAGLLMWRERIHHRPHSLYTHPFSCHWNATVLGEGGNNTAVWQKTVILFCVIIVIYENTRIRNRCFTGAFILKVFHFERTNVHLAEMRRNTVNKDGDWYLKCKFIFLFVTERKRLIYNFFQVLFHKFHS